MTKQEIQERLWKILGKENDHPSRYSIEEILSLISDVVKVVIGEDEERKSPSTPDREYAYARNDLRSEQEAKRKELLGD